MAELEYTFTNDTLFKMLFTKYPNLLKKLVAVLLKIKFEDIHKFEIRNTEMPPDALGDKFCRLDINMDVDGQRVDLEVQVKNEGDYEARTMYHWAREFSSALPSAGRYADLPRTVIISIMGFKHFDCAEYYSEFMALEVTRHELLSDKMAYLYFELPKIPTEVTADNDLELWLSLFNAKTEEELTKLEALEVPEISEAIGAYRQITVTDEFKEAERLYAKARHDEAQALYNAERKAERKTKLEVARILLFDGDSIEKVTRTTGLTREEIESLLTVS
jgi:predicted transposase/invertase (TIGR01784 family)